MQMCTFCGQHLRQGSKFCGTCGQPAVLMGRGLHQSVICPFCNSVNNKEDVFCDSCGLRLRIPAPSQISALNKRKNNMQQPPPEPILITDSDTSVTLTVPQFYFRYCRVCGTDLQAPSEYAVCFVHLVYSLGFNPGVRTRHCMHCGKHTENRDVCENCQDVFTASQSEVRRAYETVTHGIFLPPTSRTVKKTVSKINTRALAVRINDHSSESQSSISDHYSSASSSWGLATNANQAPLSVLPTRQVSCLGCKAEVEPNDVLFYAMCPRHGQVQLRGTSAPTCQECDGPMIPFRVFCGRCSGDLQVPIPIRPIATFRGRATNVDWRDLGSSGLNATNGINAPTLAFNLEVEEKNFSAGHASQAAQTSNAPSASQTQQAYPQSATYVSVVAENAAHCITEGVDVEVTGVINESGILLPLELRNLLTKAYAVKLL